MFNSNAIKIILIHEFIKFYPIEKYQDRPTIRKIKKRTG